MMILEECGADFYHNICFDNNSHSEDVLVKWLYPS